MQTDGRKIVKDLIVHRSLWQAVISDEIYHGRDSLIKLRDVERSLNSGIICISIKKDNKDRFQRVAENWNPAAIQFLPASNGDADDMVAELCFG